MKFLCDNCKAKYQISDDKVAGKTVRMKCRKCGHQIEVRSEVTETSVSLPPPGAPAAPTAPAPAAGAPRKLATSLSQTKPRPAHSEPPPSTGLAGAFQRSVQEAPVAKEPPSALDLLDMSLTEEWYAAINGVPVGPIRMAELKRKITSNAITEDSLVWQEGFEEWRPVRTIPELARIVREGQNRPSLATPPPPDARQSTAPPAPQAPHAPHAPHHAAAPAHPRTEPLHKAPLGPAAPAAPSAPAPQKPAAPLAPAASARPQVAARSNVVPITSRLATAEKLDTEPPERTLALAPGALPPPAVAPTPQPPISAPLASPFGAPPPSSSPLVAAAARDPFAPAPSDPFAMGAMAAAASPSDPFAAAVASPPAHFAPAPSLGDARERAPSIMAPPPRRGAPWWFILVAIFAGCFGIAVAVILFLNKQQPQQVVIQVPATSTATTPASATAPPSSTTVELPEVTASAAPSAKATSTVKPAGTGGGAPAATGSAIAGLGDLLKGSSGGSGPTATVGGPSGPTTAAPTFDQSSIERVVNNHKLSVRKQCLERANSDKSSTKVVANITIGPSGNVQSVSASGDDPVAAKCVENQIRGWQFPAPGETKQVQVPFTFVRQ